MPTNYYLADRRKKEECKRFEKFWEEEWFPQIRSSIYDFCTMIDGEIVNEDLAEGIIEDNLCGFSYSPLSDTLFKQSFLTVKKSGIFWHKCTIGNLTFDSQESLIKFFSTKENQDKYLIEDESGHIWTLNDLLDRLKNL